MSPLTIECQLETPRRSSKAANVENALSTLPKGRVPRIARLLALAHRFAHLLRDGAVHNEAEIARLGHVTRARVSQSMNLLFLAPDLQEQLLFLPPILKGRDGLTLRLLQPIALTPDWKSQRRLWRSLPQGGGK